jgi:hypothetical protein
MPYSSRARLYRKRATTTRVRRSERGGPQWARGSAVLQPPRLFYLYKNNIEFAIERLQ